MSVSMQQAPADWSGPPAYVPVSGWAVTALVLAIVLALPALSGVYWPEALPLVIVVLSWGPIASHRRRGMGLAIAAGLIALLAGLGGFAVSRAFSAKMQEGFGPLLKIAETGDREGAERWLLPTEDPAARSDAWKRRFDAAKEKMGPWTGDIEVGTFLLGFTAMFFPPSGVEEVPPAGEAKVVMGQALWLRARFEKGMVWVAIEGDPKAPQGQGMADLVKVLDPRSLKEDDKGRVLPRSIHDLRLFVPTATGK